MIIKKRKISLLFFVFRHKSLVFLADLFSFAGKCDDYESGQII